MRRVYSELGHPRRRSGELARVVEKHSWENIPEEEKGEGKFYRKATPGGWREDLTPGQVGIVEEITAPLLKELYPVRWLGMGLRSEQEGARCSPALAGPWLAGDPTSELETARRKIVEKNEQLKRLRTRASKTEQELAGLRRDSVAGFEGAGLLYRGPGEVGDVVAEEHHGRPPGDPLRQRGTLLRPGLQGTRRDTALPLRRDGGLRVPHYLGQQVALEPRGGRRGAPAKHDAGRRRLSHGRKAREDGQEDRGRQDPSHRARRSCARSPRSTRRRR